MFKSYRRYPLIRQAEQNIMEIEARLLTQAVLFCFGFILQRSSKLLFPKRTFLHNVIFATLANTCSVAVVLACLICSLLGAFAFRVSVLSKFLAQLCVFAPSQKSIVFLKQYISCRYNSIVMFC